ncbi:MAG TPA: hypothetical protein VLH35_04560 [Candidatus Acidoferrales bacterium]|nr:hypothetical protein [Candidatus Acidoferrales bacterium]
MQAPPALNPLRTKKYWLKMTLTVTVAVIITVFLTAQIVITQANSGSQSMDYAPGAYTRDVLTEPIVLNAKGMFFTAFEVPDQAKNAVLWGNYSISKDAADYNWPVVTIWTQQEFANYISAKSAVPYYNKEMYSMQSDNLNITLSKGIYIILTGGAALIQPCSTRGYT